MMTNQKLSIPGFGGRQDNFLYRYGQINATLKEEQVWHVVRDNDGTNLSSSHQLRASEAGSNVG